MLDELIRAGFDHRREIDICHRRAPQPNQWKTEITAEGKLFAMMKNNDASLLTPRA